MTTDDIKAMIPQWLTADEQRRIQAMFSPPIALEELAPILTNPKNWKRISKYYGGTEGDLQRIFDCRPLDDQLRLYVLTDRADTKVLRYTFRSE